MPAHFRICAWGAKKRVPLARNAGERRNDNSKAILGASLLRRALTHLFQLFPVDSAPPAALAIWFVPPISPAYSAPA